MKILIFIFAVCFITVFGARKCYFSANGTPKITIDCDNGVDYCLEINSTVSGTAFQYQGCGNFNVTGMPSGLPSSCTAAGTKTLSASGVTGQYNCCNDKDLCNDITLDGSAAPPNSTTTISPSVFAILVSIIAAFYY